MIVDLQPTLVFLPVLAQVADGSHNSKTVRRYSVQRLPNRAQWQKPVWIGRRVKHRQTSSRLAPRKTQRPVQPTSMCLTSCTSTFKLKGIVLHAMLIINFPFCRIFLSFSITLGSLVVRAPCIRGGNSGHNNFSSGLLLLLFLFFSPDLVLPRRHPEVLKQLLDVRHCIY